MHNPNHMPMTSLTSTFLLANGVEIPCIGFGTWQTPDGETAVNAVKVALEAGYRHIDTAASYKNEESVGEAIRLSGINREEIFVTTKLDNPDHGYEETKAAFNASLDKLDMDYVDLYLIHWPNPISSRHNWKEANAGSWKAFEEFYEQGKIRALGVSNFRKHHLEALYETAKIKPVVNQIHLCPGDLQPEVVAYCREQDILLEAYSPLGTGAIFEVPEMQEIANETGKTVAQVAIRWSLQKGFLPLPKSVTPERIRENAEIFDFELTDDQVATIDNLEPGIAGFGAEPDSITW